MEPLREAAAIALDDETQISVARRATTAMCTRLGLSAATASRAELVVVELAGNMLRHAGRGTLYLASSPASWASPGTCALQVIAADKGVGIGNVELAMEDGYSTSTTPGLGLGAVRRIVGKGGELGVFSQRGAGTVVSATLGEEQAPHRIEPERDAVLSTCIAGETLNGDSWLIERAGPRTVYLVVDGLGHGLHASEASGLATRLVRQALAADPGISLTALLTRIHEPMKATRGAAIAIVSVVGAVATCCGVGNVNVMLHDPGGTARSVMSHNGTLGHQMRKLQEFTFPLQPGTVLVMHSDGLAVHWKMSQYPGLLAKPPATIAGVIYRDAVRGRDDATVLVSRLDAGSHAKSTAESGAEVVAELRAGLDGSTP